MLGIADVIDRPPRRTSPHCRVRRHTGVPSRRRSPRSRRWVIRPTIGIMSWASTPGVRRSMLSNRRRDTGPELAVRRILHSQGLRYRVDFRAITNSRTRPDIVFTRQRLAVFIDGCFWHGCPVHATFPKENADYWLPKLARNIERDREADQVLVGEGWKVLRFWEHEEPETVAAKITSAVAALIADPDRG